MAEARSTGGLAGDPALDGGGVHGREEEAAAPESDHEKNTISIRRDEQHKKSSLVTSKPQQNWKK